MSRKFCLFALILLFLSAPNLLAQDDVREYEGPGNIFLGLDLGTSFSIAENIKADDLFKTRIPTVGATVGYHFTPLFSLRLQALLTSQHGNPSALAIEIDPELYKPYNFFAVAGSFDFMMNLTNGFRRYDSRNWFDCYALVGAGQLYTFGFSDYVKKWQTSVYPIDPNSYRYWQFKAGFEGAWHVARSLDLTVELDYFFTENKYNGVDSKNRLFDYFPSLRIGVSYLVPNRKHRHRFANPKVLHPYWKELN